MGAGSSQASRPGSRLTKAEVDRLHRRFTRLADSSGRVDIAQFLSMVELGGNPFTGRILQLFDGDGDGRLTAPEFQQALEYFGSLSSPEEQCKFAFRIYDLDGDGLITGPELQTTLGMLMGSYTPAQLEQVVLATLQQYDRDGDGALNYGEFKQLLTADDLAAKLTANVTG